MHVARTRSRRWFPTARRSDDAVTRRARRRAPVFDERASATAWIVAEGLASLDAVGRQRVIDGWRGRHRSRGVSLVVDNGCDVRVGRVWLGPAARNGLLHWLPLSQLELVLFDSGLFVDEPAGAIALLVRPPTIWAVADAVDAERLFPRGRQFEPERFVAIESQARRLVGPEHRQRLRAGVRRIEDQLPVGGHTVASGVIASGCAAISADDDRCTTVAARQLARYASSTWVALLLGSERAA